VIAQSGWWALLLLPAALTIWVVYRSGDTTRERVLSSTMLLERAKLISKNIRVKLPWRALIEAALLLALIAVLLDLRTASPVTGTLEIIAIDNGPRMAAAVSATSSLERLDAAKSQALVIVASLPLSSRVAVTSLNSTSEFLPLEQAAQKINEIKLTYRPGAIIDAAFSAQRTLAANNVNVISEGVLSEPQQQRPEWFNWISVSEETLNNTAISDFDTKSKTVKIAAYNVNEEQLGIQLIAKTGEILATRKVNIPASGTHAISLADFKNFPESGLIKIESSADKFVLDNNFYFTNSQSEGSIAIDSPLSIEDLGLLSLSQFKFSRIERGQEMSNLPALILHRSSLADTELTNNCAGRRLIITRLALADSNKKERITWWAESDDLLRYANLNLLEVSAHAGLDTKNSDTLISTASGALMTHAIKQSCEIITVGFEIFPFLRSGDKTISILTLNLLNWLSNGHSLTGSSAKGLSWRVPEASKAVQILPASRLEFKRLEQVLVPGLYEIIGDSSVSQPSLKNIYHASSFVSSVTSDLLSVTTQHLPKDQTVLSDRIKKQAIDSPKLLSRLFLWAAILFLAVDIAWFIARMRRVSRFFSR